MMNPKLCAVAILLFGFLTAQTYEFHRKCEHRKTNLNGEYKGFKWSGYHYYNNNTADYYAENRRFNDDYYRTMIISDFKDSLISKLAINDKSEANSLRLISVSPLAEYDFEFPRIQVLNEKNTRINMKISFAKRPKKPLYELDFILEKSNYPLQKYRFMDNSNAWHEIIYSKLLENLDSEFYQIKVVHTKVNRNGGLKIRDEFLPCEKVNLKLVLKPDQN